MDMNGSQNSLWLEGVVSSAAVAVTAALRSRIEGRSFWRPINAISHIAWGSQAAKRRGRTLRYTGTGLLLNLVACVFWAGCYQVWRRTMPKANSPTTAVLASAGTSALAYITDYHVVPRRFTPGFELCLSRRSFPWLYAALAVGMLLPQWINVRNKKRT